MRSITKQAVGLLATALLVVSVAFPALAAAGSPSNTKKGHGALSRNVGVFNTAVGSTAMSPVFLCTGAGTPDPCCTGVHAGSCGNGGFGNTAVGAEAMQSNNSGDDNAAVGESALYSNTAGSENAALGSRSLYENTTGDQNTAVGTDALHANTTGDENTAVGQAALGNGTVGSRNTAVGKYALVDTTGHGNTALGYWAGSSLTTGNNNIDIGDQVLGVAGESNTIRIGNTDHANAHLTYIQGIYQSGVNGFGINVMVDNAGKLGTGFSSARFKDDIQDMGNSSSRLLELRPVRFRYKQDFDPSGLEQYGLIAEEVAKLYPDLVAYDDQGQPVTVRYHFINAMLLNEVQKQARRIEALERILKVQARRIETLSGQTRVADLQAQKIEELTARLVQLEATVGGQRRGSAVEASLHGGM